MKKGICIALMALSFSANAEVNYLESQVRTTLPADVKTIRQAAHYFLKPHSYRLVERNQDSRLIGGRPVPVSFAAGQVVTIEEALLGLADASEAVVVDIDNRLVMFNKLEKELMR